MAGRIAFDLLLFLLPFLLYGIYIWYARWRLEHDPKWRDAPLAWLTMAGLGLVLISFVAWRLLEPANRDGTYVPARIENGKIVPGEMVN